MRLYVGVTDGDWYRFLAKEMPDEVNFWQPGGRLSFNAIEPGEPFLFKLHYPENFIVGGAFFVRQSLLPLSIAWEAFGRKNGVRDFSTFMARIRKYRQERGDLAPDPTIGCIVLTAPFFFGRDAWIPMPSDWKRNIVQGKTYSTSEPTGARLWQQVRERLENSASVPFDGSISRISEEASRYGPDAVIRRRLGQGAFRVLVTEAYSRRCAFTGERTLPVLQASHIKPYAEDGPHAVSNGLLLRSDLHLLFDRGLITVTPEYRIEVSQRIKREYENGRIYYALHGQHLAVVPGKEIDRPSSEFIDWHNQHVFGA